MSIGAVQQLVRLELKRKYAPETYSRMMELSRESELIPVLPKLGARYNAVGTIRAPTASMSMGNKLCATVTLKGSSEPLNLTELNDQHSWVS